MRWGIKVNRVPIQLMASVISAKLKAGRVRWQNTQKEETVDQL